MIKNYSTYINENIHSDIDPFGEEEWDDETILKPGDKVICINDTYNNQLKLGKEYEIKDIDYEENTLILVGNMYNFNIRRFRLKR